MSNVVSVKLTMTDKAIFLCRYTHARTLRSLAVHLPALMVLLKSIYSFACHPAYTESHCDFLDY